MRQILLFAALAAVLALLLVSCGGTKDKPVPTEAVSYTHLTLPTIA